MKFKNKFKSALAQTLLVRRSLTATEVPWRIFLQSTALQRFSALNNYQGTLLFKAEITDSSLYFHNCARKKHFLWDWSCSHYLFCSFYPYWGHMILFRASFICLQDFSRLGKVCKFDSFSLNIFSIVPKDSRSPDPTTLLSYLIQDMQRYCLCQV